MEFVRKFVRLLFTFTIISIIVYGLVHVPELFGYHKLIIDSDYMKTLYPKGTIVYYYETNNINSGDIITYKKDDDVVCGRVYSTIDNGYVIKYDNASAKDNVLNKNVLGKNINIIILFLGIFINFVNNNCVLYIVVSLIIIVLNIIFSKKRVKHKKVLEIDE